MPRVNVPKTHPISISDGQVTIGFKLDGGPPAFLDNPARPSTLYLSSAISEHGSGDPHFTEVEQASWEGGAGLEIYDSLELGFADATNAFTAKRKALFAAPQWRYADGDFRNVASHMPGDVGADVSWYKLYPGVSRYITQIFSPVSTISASRLCGLWLRRVGKPRSSLTFKLRANSAGDPSTLLETDTLAVPIKPDAASFVHRFGWASRSLTGGTSYHLEVFGGSDDDAENHWEVGFDVSFGTPAKSSANESSWTALTGGIFYRVTEAGAPQRTQRFKLQGAWYVLVDYLNTATASRIYIQGDRGKCSAASSVATLTDSTKSWVTNEWAGCVAYTWTGDGYGQYVLILSNTATILTLDEAWDTAIGTNTHYVILGSRKWTQLTSTGLGNAVDVEVLADVAYFSQGMATNIRRFHYDTATGGHGYADDSTNKADLLYALGHSVDGAQMWRATNKKVGAVNSASRANAVQWGSGHSFKADTKVGDIGTAIRDLAVYDNVLWTFCDEHPYAIYKDRAEPVLPEMANFPHETNGVGSTMHDTFLFVPFGGFTLGMVAGLSLIDVGRDRMPSNRAGAYTSLQSHSTGLFVGVDAGKYGVSSVMFRDDAKNAYHEFFRAPVVGDRIRDHGVWWEAVPYLKPKLWIAVGKDLVFQEYPVGTLDPLRDLTMKYQHEADVETATHDFGKPSRPKYVGDIVLVSKDLGSGTEVYLDYQVDLVEGGQTSLPANLQAEEVWGVDSGGWNVAGKFENSPEGVVKLRIGGIRRIKFRLRIMNADADVPAKIHAFLIKAFVRLASKRLFSMRVVISDKQRTKSGARDFTPEQVLEWLKDKSDNAEALIMRTGWKDLKEVLVIIEPGTVRRDWLTRSGKAGMRVMFSLRDAT